MVWMPISQISISRKRRVSSVKLALFLYSFVCSRAIFRITKWAVNYFINRTSHKTEVNANWEYKSMALNIGVFTLMSDVDCVPVATHIANFIADGDHSVALKE